MGQYKHKIVPMSIALVLALVLWIYVVTVIAPEATATIYDVSIVLDGESSLKDRGLIITGQQETGINLEINASRTTLSKLNRGNVAAVADVSKISDPGEYSLSITISLPDTVSSADVDVVKKSASTIHITVAEAETKTVPIELQWTGDVTSGYQFDAENAVANPETVTLYGPKTEVDPVAKAVVLCDISGLEETTQMTKDYTFQTDSNEEVELSNLTAVDVETIDVTLPILRYREIPLTVELQDGGGVTAKDATAVISPDKIAVTGAAEVIDALPDTFSVGTIDLAKVLDGEQVELPLTLPAGVNSASGEKTVTVTMYITGYTKEITTSNIQVINVPKGYTAQVTTKSVTVTLRGEQEYIEAITEEDVTVIADLSNYAQSGAFTVEAKAQLPDFPAADVVGTIGVSVSLK